MPRRTQVFQKVPWSGGINTSVDAGVLPVNDLVQADNIIATTSGTRAKRQGLSFFDTAVPSIIKRSSSGTTRTIVFSASVSRTAPTDQVLVVGEAILVAGCSVAAYNNGLAQATVLSIATTTITNDTVTYTFSGAGSLTEALTAETTAVVTKAHAYIGVHDFWYYDYTSNQKVQKRVAISNQAKIYTFDENGKRTEVVKAASTATSFAVVPVQRCDLRTFGNKLMMTFSGTGNTPKTYDPLGASEWHDMPGAPDGSIMMEHQGRLWMDDKNNLDYLQFSAPFDYTQWQGIGDSGTLPLSEGDGDPVGITAICPPFKGRLIVGKDTRVYQIIGSSPEEYQIVPMTNGVGTVSHKAVVAYDMDDVYYYSKRGVHSVNATDQFGDFSGKFLSQRIQNTFNTWNPSLLRATQGTYIPSLNCVAWIIAETGHSKPNAVWLYNPTVGDPQSGEQGIWFRWPNVNATSITTVLQDDVVRPMFGTSAGRMIIGQNTVYTDFGTTGIPFRIKSGAIYVDGNPQTVKAFKKLTLLFKPRGRYNFTVYFKVDNMPPQALSFTQQVQGDKLGQTFKLGSSILGSNPVLAPFTQDVFGHGRGCSIEVFQTGLDAQVEIYGFMIEYETADISEAVNLGGSSNASS